MVLDPGDDDAATGLVQIRGDLQVDGTTTTVNSVVMTVQDPIITLGGEDTLVADDNKDRGIEFGWHNGSAAKVGFFGFDDSTQKFTFIPDATNTSEVFAGTAGTIVAALEGNADTASTLQTARTISLAGDVSGSVSFNGGSDVSITATVADDSHNHTISNIDGLQTEIDTKAELAGSSSQAFSASTLNATTVDLGNWTVTESSGVLYFATGGTNKMKLDASGNLTVVGNVTAYGSV